MLAKNLVSEAAHPGLTLNIEIVLKRIADVEEGAVPEHRSAVFDPWVTQGSICLKGHA